MFFNVLYTAGVCCDHVEGGMYIGPEFQLGQVYDGGGDSAEPVLLYRPVYVYIPNPVLTTTAPSAKTKRQIFDSKTSSRSITSGSLLSKMDSSSSGLNASSTRARSNTGGNTNAIAPLSADRIASTSSFKESNKFSEKIEQRIDKMSLKETFSCGVPPRNKDLTEEASISPKDTAMESKGAIPKTTIRAAKESHSRKSL